MKKFVSLVLVAFFSFGILAYASPVSAQDYWTVSSESVFVGNKRVFRVASTPKLTASERAAIIHQRLAVLQGNYPGFNPLRIGIVAAWVVSNGAEDSPTKGCPDIIPQERWAAWLGSDTRTRLYIVIGYFRLPDEPAFVGEETIGALCAYTIRDYDRPLKDLEWEKIAYFIPIVTVTPQDAKLHGKGIYEADLAREWTANLKKAFAAQQ